MSTMIYLMEAWIIGIAIAAPVGPIGMLCIRKTLETGLVGALAVGLGAALADSVYGLIAATGLTAVSHFLLTKAVYIKLIGGAFLLYLAYSEIVAKPSNSAVKVGNKKTCRLVTEVFFLTLTNPATILSFIGIFASIGGGATTGTQMAIMVIGIFLGSMTWWLILGTLIISIKHKLPESWIHGIRYLSALILGGFGIWAMLSVLRGIAA